MLLPTGSGVTIETLINRFLAVSAIRRWHGQNIRIWLRLLIVVGVLFLSVGIAFFSSPPSFKLLIVALSIFYSAILILRWPPLGLLILIISSLTVDFSIDTGTYTSLNITVLLIPVLIALWLINLVILKREKKLVPSRTVPPILIFLLLAVLSFGFGQLPWFATTPSAPLRSQLGGLAIFFFSGGAFLLVAHQVRNLRWLQWLTWLFILIAGIYIIGGLVPGIGRFTSQLVHRSATGSIFWVWLVALASGQAIFNRRLHLVWRLVLGGLVLAIFYSNLGITPGWTSGWLPALVGLAFLLLVGFPRLAPALILAGGIGAALNAQRIYDLLLLGGNRYSLVTRLEAWRIIAEVIRDNPILGLGPANYYWYTPLFPILGWSVSFNSHNNYVDIIAQTGFLGLVCFLWFCWEVARLGMRVRTQAEAGFAQGYVYGVLGGLAGTMVAAMLGDWVLPFVYNIGLGGFRTSVFGWLFLGGLVAVEQMTSRSHDVNTTPRV